MIFFISTSIIDKNAKALFSKAELSRGNPSDPRFLKGVPKRPATILDAGRTTLHVLGSLVVAGSSQVPWKP